MMIPGLLVSLFFITKFIRFYNYKQFTTAKLVHVSINYRGKQNIFQHFFKFKGNDGIIYKIRKNMENFVGEVREIDGEKFMVTDNVVGKFIYPKNNPDEAVLINSNSKIAKLINKYIFNSPLQA